VGAEPENNGKKGDGRTRRAGRAVAAAARRIEQDARLVTAVKLLREFLPGDS
jgi:hypothetical protein